MKSLLSSSVFVLLALRLFAQETSSTPLFLLFTKDCMDQLEYRYTYSGAGVQSYTVRPNSNEEYLLKAGTEGITSPTLPKGSVTCRGFTMNAAFVDAINSLRRQVYVVHQTPTGYLQIPIIEAAQVNASGTFYLFRAAGYSFALDSTKMQGAVNLAAAGSNAYVYLTGVVAHACRREYSFRREPAQQGMERMDFDYIPGIGLTMLRSGKTAAEAEGNTSRLYKVNGTLLDDYLGTACRNQRVPEPSTLPQYAPEFGYGSTNPPGTGNAYTEPGKEDYPGAGRPVGPPLPLVNCPELPGQGYHIVQPKESLRAIARTYNVDIKNLQKWNNIKNANYIEICQKIWLKQPPRATASKGNTAAQAPKAEDGTRVQDQSIYWGQTGLQAPAAYNYPSPATGNAYEMQAMQPVPANATRPMLHTVKRGEYLYAISKTYNCPEACIRRANNMAPEGDVPLRTGQQVVIPDCKDCATVYPYYYNTQQPQVAQPLPGTTGYLTNPVAQPVTPTQQYENLLSGPAPSQYATPTQQQPYYTQQPAPAYQQPAYQQPQQYNYNDYGNAADQVYDQRTSTANPPAAATPKGNTSPPAYFQEYIVKQGETLPVIAARFKVSAAELTQINALETNETLMPGKRLLIPRQ